MQAQRSFSKGAMEDSWRKDVQQMMYKIRYLTGILRSQNLGMLTDQLEQAGYRIVAGSPAVDGDDRAGDGATFIRIARSCIREIEYQLMLAREANMPSRRAHEPMHREFCEIRRMLATCIRRARKRQAQ